MSSSLRSLFLPAVAGLVLVGFMMWKRSLAPAPEAAPTSAATRPGAAAGAGEGRRGEAAEPRGGAVAGGGEAAGRAAEAAGAVNEPGPAPARVQATVRDRERSEAARQVLRERLSRAAMLAQGTGGEGPRASGPPALDKEYIRERIREDLMPIAKECYESALEDQPELGGKLVMKFTIVGDAEVGGVVDESEVAPESDLQHAGLRECMRESMLSLTFPPPEDGGTVTVTYPFVFAADGPPAK